MREPSERLDVELEALSSRQRREILRFFVTTDAETATVETLSGQLTRAWTDGGDDQPPPTGAIRAELHHVHLPKLADCGLLEYDPRSNTARYRPDERVEELVAFVSDERGEQ